MKLGGLFSGVGGFELAWTKLGHEVAWMCEWDAKARKVLEARFPGVPIYPDVRDLDPAEVEAVDVLTGGSPCQGFSVAGNRTGLEHSESQLFRDYIRIMDGLAERGLRYALWENVPGVLSITNEDGERTFNHVVAALAGGTEPVRLPADKRWNTGLAAGRGRAVAWRVLDSRYFGVAQRRRRVFACVAFGDSCEDRAGRALLAKSEGVRGDSPASVQAREGVAGVAEDRAGVPSIAPTVTSKWAKGSGGPAGSETGNMIVDAKWWDGGQIADSLTTTSDAQRMPDKQRFQAVIDSPSGFRMTAFGQYEDDDSASTLKQRDHKDATDLVMQPQAFNWQQGDAEYSLRDDSSALAADSRPAVMIPKAFRKAARAQSSEDAESWVEDGQANTLNVFDVGDTRTTHAIVEPPAYGVRRLTPVECERLQSFPDGWTEPAGSDSARYKAMGNAVTVNVVRWILRRMVEAG